jgi:Fur family ferric uptake transcriptional regulator
MMPEAKRRNTPQKDAIRHALGNFKGFVSAQQLHGELAGHGSKIGLATVYRTLAAMATDGEADSLTAKDGEALYRACTGSHHHHIICQNCGLTLEIEASKVETWADEMAANHGFTQASHTIDIFGICPDCRRN